MFLAHCNFPRCAHLCEVVIHFHIKDENEAALCSVNIENCVNVTRREELRVHVCHLAIPYLDERCTQTLVKQ
jgi:hypothetical protein